MSGADGVGVAGGILTEPLRVRVIDQDGKPRPGVTVVFEPTPVSLRQGTVEVNRAQSPSDFFASTSATSNARGEAAVWIRLGTKAGPGGLVVTVPELGYQDTARYTIYPGPATKVAIAPEDSAVLVGGSYALRGAVVDRYGNPASASDAVSYTVGPSSISLAGTVVRGDAIGRGFVVARAGAWSDTAWVSVVPPGTLAVNNRRIVEEGRKHAFAIFDTDGSNYRGVLDPAAEALRLTDERVGLTWSPRADELFFSDGLFYRDIYATTLAGRARRITPGAEAQQRVYASPHFSRDGEWLFYNFGNPASSSTEIWRARPDGSQATRVTQPMSSHKNDFDPSPSPDGRRIVFETDRERGWMHSSLHLLDLSTGAVQSLGIEGTGPEWSPVSDWIAYERGRGIWMVRSDGSGDRLLTPAGVWYQPSISWSADGEWIAVSRGVVELIHVETGLVLPLGFTSGFLEPVWRP